jgi:hypothetical protein
MSLSGLKINLSLTPFTEPRTSILLGSISMNFSISFSTFLNPIEEENIIAFDVPSILFRFVYKADKAYDFPAPVGHYQKNLL